MWTIIILVLFVIAGVIGLAFALRARPRRIDGVASDNDAPGTSIDHGADAD